MVAVTAVRWRSNSSSEEHREDVGIRTSIFALRQQLRNQHRQI